MELLIVTLKRTTFSPWRLQKCLFWDSLSSIFWYGNWCIAKDEI